MSENSKESTESKRKPAEERADAFNFLAWLAEGAAGVASELKDGDLGLSQEFWTHSDNARREGLLAARALLDQLIERTEQKEAQEKERGERQARRGNISIG